MERDAQAEVNERTTDEHRKEWQDWERWAREVLTDFRIPFDNHKIGMRLAIVQWMADHNQRP